MSCPDWKQLAAHRDDLEGAEPAGWQAALEHLDGGCKECRPRALAADPTLVFRRMPVLDLRPAEEDSEIASMRQAVAAMRTASRLEALETHGRRSSLQGWRRWAAAAVLTFATLSLGSDNTRRERPLEQGEEGTAAAVESTFGSLGVMAMPAALSDAGSGMEAEPLFEDLSRDSKRVYELSGDSLDAVLVVTGSADV